MKNERNLKISCSTSHAESAELNSMTLKVCSCVSLLFFSVAATLSAEASKSPDGTYPYNSFVIPCIVEAVKLLSSSGFLVASVINHGSGTISLKPLRFASYALPAFCYFVSNNCMFYIIRLLGPTTFQITNNLKTLATGVLMRIFLGRKLTWLRWKALCLLVLGSVVAQLDLGSATTERTNTIGYALVFANSFAAGAGGVISEKLLKGGDENHPESIHWQNVQLYIFGLFFGLISTYSSLGYPTRGIFDGFNQWAYATVVCLAAAGLLVSFILKYLDNFAKCFVAAFSIVIVAVVHAAMNEEALNTNLLIGIILTCMAIEQYTLPQ